MPIGNLAASAALQKEYLVPKLEKLSLASSRLWKHFKLNTEIKPVSNRPVRIPTQPLTAGKFRAANFDGGDMGLGSGPQTVPMTATCVSFVQASQWTAQAEYSTDSDVKAIEDYVAVLQSQQMETMGGYIDALLQSDGSNTLDTVVSVSGSTLTVNNPNAFQPNQDVDFYSNLLDQGGTFLGSSTIVGVDVLNMAITLPANPPAGVGAGTRMLVSGSAGVSNSGLLGLRAWNVAGNTGSYGGIQKSAYPGTFNVPNIASPGALTPAVVRAIDNLIALRMGLEKADAVNLTPHCNIDGITAWENNAILVQRIDLEQVRGDSSPDMLKKRRPRTIAGREALINERARPGYIDMLALEHWFQIQSKALSLYDVKGQVVFPTYGASGGVSASMLMYLVIQLQVISKQPGLNAYISGFAPPKYILGH